MFEGFANLQRDLSANILIKRYALDQAIILCVRCILLHLALVIKYCLLTLVAAGMEGFPRDVDSLAPGWGHVKDLCCLLNLATLRLLRGGSCIISIQAAAVDTRCSAFSIEHDILKVARVVQVQLNLRGATHLHIDPQVFVVPNKVDLQVWATIDVIDSTRCWLHVHVLLHFTGAFTHEDPAMNSPILILILLAGWIILRI
mmetsp:Transcript_133036/g.332022  ORF Transcript_133036/g.332022 Transcript_133036/m.332022 type:complete len:201 (+) Transcript_133036:1393-1995(+)